MTIRTRSLLAAALLSLAMLAGCDRPETAWQEAQEADTIAAYQDFLDRHPDAPQAADAERRITEIRRAQRWQETAQADAAEAYEQFLAEFPDAPEAEQARERLAGIEREQQWAALRDTDDIDALRDFAERHRDHAVGAQARQRADVLEAAEFEAAERERARIAEEERRRAEEADARRTHRVQLAALRSAERARDGASLLQRQFADVLGELAVEVAEVGAFHVVRTQPVPEEDARSLCERIRAEEGDCVVTTR
jgi:hypothetical protein